MIQRIQTVYLLLVALIGGLLYIYPLVSLVPANANAEPVIYHVSALKVEMLTNGTSDLMMRFWPVVVLKALVIAFALLIVFQYRNRRRQMNYTQLLLLLNLAQIVLLVVDVDRLLTITGTNHQVSYSVFAVLPVIQLVLTRLATAAIRKDDELVRSADRLR